MILDLDPLPYRCAIDIIKWCFDRDIDKEKCAELIHAMSILPQEWSKELEWTLDVPDKYLTFFLIKWSGHLSASPTE
jgi:hypothetical protein